jgi:UDP-GlcNAc:undecaprenyl-phosphate GlcNAc-1-phosphate transferase
MIGLIAAFTIALLVTWLLTPHVLNLAVHLNVLAIPRERDVHVTPTPRWGGIAIYAGVISAVLITVTYRHFVTHGDNGWSWRLCGVLIAATFIALVGMLDDIKDLRAYWQALAIICAGIILIAFGVRIEGISNPLVTQKPGVFNSGAWISFTPALSVLVTLFWVFLVTKTVDAVDGLDGLAAGVCAISAATLALLAAASSQPEGPSIALLAAAVVGACVGFLRFNYNPAKIFMSTVGAQFLGFLLASISIMGTFKWAAAISVAVPILVLGVPIIDYGIVLIQRFIQKAPLTEADRRHFHHRLLDKGLTQKQAVWVIYGCTAMLCCAAIILFKVSR